MCFSFFKAQGLEIGDSLVEDEGVEPAREALAEAEGSDCEADCCRSTWCWGASSAPTPSVSELDGIEVPDGWMGLDVGPRTAARYAEADRRTPGRCSGTARWAPSSWSRSRPAPGRWPRPSPGARQDRGRRRRLGRGAGRSSASPTRSTGSRPAAAPRWSCSRARSCPAWRRCSTQACTDDVSAMPERTPFIAANWKMNKTVAEAEEFVDALLPRIAATRSRRRRSARRSRRSARWSSAARRPRSRSPRRTCTRTSGRVHRRGLGADAARARRRRGRARPLRAAPVLRRDRRGAGPARCRRRWRPGSSRSSASARREAERDGGETEEVLERQLQADLAEVERRATSPRS